jgi:hypothetical protein
MDVLGHNYAAGCGRGHGLFACLVPAALHTFDSDRIAAGGCSAFRLTIWLIRLCLSALAGQTNLHPETTTGHSPT